MSTLISAYAVLENLTPRQYKIPSTPTMIHTVAFSTHHVGRSIGLNASTIKRTRYTPSRARGNVWLVRSMYKTIAPSRYFSSTKRIGGYSVSTMVKLTLPTICPRAVTTSTRHFPGNISFLNEYPRYPSYLPPVMGKEMLLAVTHFFSASSKYCH